jgi:hypothetical protein
VVDPQVDEIRRRSGRISNGLELPNELRVDAVGAQALEVTGAQASKAHGSHLRDELRAYALDAEAHELVHGQCVVADRPQARMKAASAP